MEVCMCVCVFYSANTLVAAHCLAQSDEKGFQGHLMKVETPNGFKWFWVELPEKGHARFGFKKAICFGGRS